MTNETYYKILPCGVKLVHRRTGSEVAYVGVMVGAGTRHETADINGIAHYIEHCVFKGVMHGDKPLSADGIINRIEGIGGEINAYTTKEETTFYAATPTRYAVRTLQLLLDMVRRPTFPHEETEKELGVIYDEIDSYEDSPGELIYDDFESMLFQGASLALPILGTRKTLRRFSRTPQTALEWVHSHYTPERMVIFSQGNIRPEKLAEVIEMEFSSLPPHDACSLLGEQVMVNAPRTDVFRRHTHQSHVMLGRTAYPIGHPKQLALYVLNNILGGGALNSRLNMSIREKEGLVYTIESQYTPLSNTGYWSVYFASEPQHKDECIERIFHELKALRERPLSQKEWKRAIRQLHGQMAISAENRENNFLSMGKLMLYYGAAPAWKETFQKIAQLTPADLQAVACEMYQEQDLSILSYE